MITTPVKAWLEALLAPHIDQAHAIVIKKGAAAPAVTATSSTPLKWSDGGDNEPLVATGSPSSETTPESDASALVDTTSSLPNSPIVALHNQLVKAKKDITWATTQGASSIIQRKSNAISASRDLIGNILLWR